MNKYKCHKVVEAASIISFASDKELMLSDGTTISKGTTEEISKRGTPKVGDYVVKYEDGYLSWSPKEVFEAGYSLLEE